MAKSSFSENCLNIKTNYRLRGVRFATTLPNIPTYSTTKYVFWEQPIVEIQFLSM